MEIENQKSIDLLWTGGWDSTFRLLYLIFIKKKIVRPHYIIDSDRKSLRMELKAISEILKMISAKSSTAFKLVLPIQYSDLNFIQANINISDSYKKVFDLAPIGIQYDWLARYCEEKNIMGMELSVEKGDNKLNNFIIPLFKELQEDASGDTNYRIDENKSSFEYDLFKYFTFPIIELSRTDMEIIAKKECFIDIMEKTWFCHRPTNKQKPCGVCYPCITAIEEKQIWRFPLQSRIRYYLYVKTGLRKFRKRFLRKELIK